MRNRIFKDFGIKIVSVFFAIIIWMVIVNVDDYIITRQINNIEVEIINSEAITSNDKVFEVVEGKTVNIVIKGKRSVVEYLKSVDFKAVADMSKLSVTNAVQIVITPVDGSISSDVTISCVDNMMIVEIEDKIEKQLPVTVTTTDKPHADYAVGDKSATPNMVVVSGPESIVSKLQEARVVVSVDGAKDNFTELIEPKFYDGNGELVESANIECNVLKVEVSIEILKTKTVPVKLNTMGDTRDGYQVISVDYQPTEIKLVGAEDVLQSISDISISDIDISDLYDSTEIAIDVSDYLPEGVKIADGTEQIMVKIVIEKLKTIELSFSKDDIGLENAIDEYDYEIVVDDNLIIQMLGLADIVLGVTIEDLKPSIDVNGFGVGSYNVEISYKDLNGVTILNDINITLTVKKK